MPEENKNILYILLILALFTGATIEMSEGSALAGIVLILLAVLVFTRLQITSSASAKNSYIYALIGVVMIIADVAYNLQALNQLGTLDTMVFFLGASLVVYGLNIQQFAKLGEFGIYISASFLFLFIIFYSTFGALNIDFLHLFDHYFVLLPTVSVIKLFGIPVEVVATETVQLGGVVPMTIVIGGPCSGLYSMFLLIGIVFGYSRIEKMELNKTLALLGVAVVVAYISNLVRVIILYITAFYYGLDTMMVVHTHLGWIIFAAVAGSIMFLLEKYR
ncbi:archaeosortase C (PEF-CTERM variant) [Methanohalophilus levihalophilus]|uniref:archaeosortase C n=1 Tax=Methanohalophilus levihalophilus TaxID=1431282 RepID=UPI001AE7EB25|nr:archaeosortase C [Methanohalophilus levihalophilus]MBP2031240.1 archaeosortase C (PEF-CTERM variant) [Methanohalophilus levihalophilus]